nr:MAG TPA: hypothetical protein [Caudoviricetes sp.]
MKFDSALVCVRECTTHQFILYKCSDFWRDYQIS